MSQSTVKQVAQGVLLQGLQSWGQSMDERVRAWQNAFNFINLSAVLSVGKDRDDHTAFLFNGPDADKAKEFMLEVKRRFPLGNFEREQAMIEDCLKIYAKA